MWTPVSGGVELEFDAIEVLTTPVTFQGIVNRVMDIITEDMLNTSIDLVFDKNRDGLSREDEQKMWNCIHKNKELFHRYIRVEGDGLIFDRADEEKGILYYRVPASVDLHGFFVDRCMHE